MPGIYNESKTGIIWARTNAGSNIHMPGRVRTNDGNSIPGFEPMPGIMNQRRENIPMPGRVRTISGNNSPILGWAIISNAGKNIHMAGRAIEPMPEIVSHAWVDLNHCWE